MAGKGANCENNSLGRLIATLDPRLSRMLRVSVLERKIKSMISTNLS